MKFRDFRRWIINWAREKTGIDYGGKHIIWYQVIQEVAGNGKKGVQLFYELSQQFFDEFRAQRVKQCEILNFFSGNERLGEEKTKLIVNMLRQYFISRETFEGKPLAERFRKPCFNRSLEEIKKLAIPNSENLFFYLENTRTIHLAEKESILQFINSIDPWPDMYVYFFDESFDWIITKEHGDQWSVCGLEYLLGYDMVSRGKY